MASYKSHSNPPRRLEDPSPYSHRAPSTRLPQRAVTSTSRITSPVPTSHHSKLQKRQPSKDERSHPSREVTSLRVPVSKSSVTKSRQGGATPTVPYSQPASSMPVPKSVRQASSSRLPKLDVVGDARTPSLVSGSSASTIDSPRSNLLRRKPSNIGIGSGKQSSRTRAGSMSDQEDTLPANGIPGGYKDPFSETVLGISIPPSSNILAHAELEIDPLTQYFDYQMSQEMPGESLRLPTPQYALSATPSTRYSESPGAFSVSSTPTSMSSYSPGTALSTKSTARAKTASPLQSRPPVTRHRTNESSAVREQHGLSAVRESTTSSSSTSTILAEASKKEKSSRARLPAPPPSPPVNSNPMYFTLSPSEQDISPRDTSMVGQQSPPSQEHATRIQAPPELAHLADYPSVPVQSRRPRRPSRDGTPDMMDLKEPSPIIQSNMTSVPSPHKRTSSTDSKVSVLPQGRSRFGIPSKSSSRNPSPNPSLGSGFAPISRVPTRGPTPEISNDAENKRANTLPNPAPSQGKTSKFGFFSRRTKTEPPVPTAKPEKKLRRKGPVAGTGHEGYGKYSMRGRSGSMTSGGSIGRSISAGTTTESLDRTPSSRKSSMTSTTSTEMDDFFLERLNPVAIRGTGSSTELSRSPEPMHSGSSLDLAKSSNSEMKKATPYTSRNNVSQTTLEKGRPKLLPSAMSDPVRQISPMKKRPVTSRRPSESEDESKRSFLPTLSTKRSSRIPKDMGGAPLSKVPTPAEAKENLRKGSVGGSKSQGRDDYTSDGKEGKWLKSKKKEDAPAKRTRKWNFFQRTHAAPKPESSSRGGDTATTRPPPSRSTAHYALMDQAGLDLDDIEQIMQEADSTPDEPSPTKETSVPERLQSMLLPPKPVLPSDFPLPARSASPKVNLRPEGSATRNMVLDASVQEQSRQVDRLSQASVTDMEISPCSSPFRPASPVEPESQPKAISAPTAELAVPQVQPASTPSPRPSRLQQVGRIPQVVSHRSPDRRPISQSFSRPFNSGPGKPVMPFRTSFDCTNAIPATAGPVEPYPVLQGLSALSHGSAIATISPSAEESNRLSEFFKFPSRKGSEISYSSSSGIWSFAPTTGTAIVPPPSAPQSDDEIWKEYDDLIDDVLSPVDSVTAPFFPSDEKKRHLSLTPAPLKTKPSHRRSQSGSSAAGASNSSLHIRRSRLLAVLHSSQSIESPFSMTEFLTGYGDRNLSVVDPVTGRLSFPSTARMSSGSGPLNRPSSARSSLPASLSLSARQSKATLASSSDKDRESASANRYRDSRLMELAEAQSDGLVSMANLRFGALMTSKWLSFGRVLFSPAHFELKDPNEDRILVIDGLGKDWSYYCALTYPEATIYNLGPGALSSPAQNSSTSEPWSSLPNHRHISHQSFPTAFPFPRGFFACVVLRFPPALPSHALRAVLSECKQVLRPGGHLEICAIDLDLVNMGNRARRAIRSLKVKMQVADEDISLRNTSDEIMSSLGRKGFVECNRCFVGVPVGGKLPSPDESESPKRKGSMAAKTPKAEMSFSELLNSRASADSSDSTYDSITDMVARVGRWWYSRCYESLVLPEAGEPGAANSGSLLESSIWRDEALIRECEKRGTSFKLLIGYAQKPEVGVRRTVSV